MIGDYDSTLVTLRNGTDGTAGGFADWGDGDPFAGIITEYVFNTPAFGDLDADGDLDLVISNYYHGTLVTYENTTPRGVALTVEIAAVNEAPVAITLPDSATAVEDEASALDLSGVVIADADSPGAMAVTLIASAGTQTATGDEGVAVAGTGTGALTLTGMADAIDAWLNAPEAVRYAGATDAFGTATITIAADDGEGPVARGQVNLRIAEAVDPWTGTAADNRVEGDGGRDAMAGGAGNDGLFGRQGDDTLLGGDGDDVLVGGRGDDLIDGGRGRDTAVFQGGADATVRLDVTGAQDTGRGLDRLVRIENVTTNAGDDRLTGDDRANRLSARDGDDRLAGGSGDDRLLGGRGADTLDGGRGADMLEGGAGADTFVFRAGFGRDRIVDFADDVDTVHLDDALWGGGLSKSQVVATYGVDLGEACLLDFGGGDAIRFAGVDNLRALVDDLVFV